MDIIKQLNENVLPVLTTSDRKLVNEFLTTINTVIPVNVDKNKFISESLKTRFGKEIPALEKLLKNISFISVLESMNLDRIFSRLNDTIESYELSSPNFLSSVQTIYEGYLSNKISPLFAFDKLHNILNEQCRPEFEFILNEMENFVNENRENIHVFTSNKMTNDYIDNISAEMINVIVENYVLEDNKNDEFRTSILEKLEPFTTVSLKAKAITNNIKSFMKNTFNVASRDNFIVEDVYSFVRVTPKKDKMIFGNKRNLFEMNLESFEIRKLVNEGQEFADILDLNTFCTTGRNNISNKSINIYFNEDHLNLTVNEDNSKQVNFNGKPVNENFHDFMDKLSKMNMIRNKTRIMKVYERLDNFLNIDFAKNISTKDNTANTTIFHFGDRFYADMTNPIVETNKFLVEADANQLHSEILEFMGFDLENTLNEFMNPIKQELNVFNTQMNVVNSNIMEIETMLETLQEFKNSSKLEDIYNEDVFKLDENLQNELALLKHEKSVLQAKIYELKNPEKTIVETKTPTLGEKYFGHFINEDETITDDPESVKSTMNHRSNRIVPNMQVFIKDINKHGIISSVNTIQNLVNIITMDGQTLSYDIKEVGKNIQLIQGEVIKNLDDMADKAEDVKDKAEELQNESFLYESMTPQSNSIFKGVGIKGHFDSNYKKNLISEEVIPENENIKKDDISTLNSIIGKLEAVNNTFSEIEEFLKTYQKINKKPISDILQQIESFKEVLVKQSEKI